MRLPIYVLVLAVVLAALTAGPAGADVPDNSVTSAKIVTGAIQAVDIANSAIKSNKIRNGAVTTSKLAADIGVLSLGTGYSGGDQVLTGTMSFDATYTTGGEDVTTTLGTIRSVMTVPSKSGYVFEVVETSFATGSFKLKAMQGASTTGSALAEG